MSTTTPTVEVTVSAWSVRIDGNLAGGIYDCGDNNFHATTGTGGLSVHRSSRDEAVAALIDYHTNPAKHEDAVVHKMAIAMCERSSGKGAWDGMSKGDQDFFIADARAARDAMRANR